MKRRAKRVKIARAVDTSDWYYGLIGKELEVRQYDPNYVITRDKACGGIPLFCCEVTEYENTKNEDMPKKISYMNNVQAMTLLHIKQYGTFPFMASEDDVMQITSWGLIEYDRPTLTEYGERAVAVMLNAANIVFGDSPEREETLA